MAERAFRLPQIPRQYSPLTSKPRAQPAAGAERAEILDTIDRLSHWMDTAFEVPLVGWRFGFDAIVGLIPGLGDAATTLVSVYILALASRCGLPRVTLARMGLNVAIDGILGSLPLVGDLFDVWWKANQMNAALLRERLAESSAALGRARATDWLFVGGMAVVLLAIAAGALALTVVVVAALWNLTAGLFR